MRSILLSSLWLSSAVLAYYFRTPLFASIRYLDFIAVIILISCMIGLAKRRWSHKVFALTLLLSLIPLSMICTKEVIFQYKKMVVLQADPALLAYYGQHFIVGHRSRQQAELFIEQLQVGGIYLTQRNVQGMDHAEAAAYISWLKSLTPNHESNLIVASDQEGGVVSHLSPPLPAYQSLAQVIAETTTTAERDQAVQNYAQQLSEDLVRLGVTMNLAPVVDLTHPDLAYQNDYTQIHHRSISQDPATVTAVAATYASTLRAAGVDTVYKHFPGLGRITADTHLAKPHLSAAAAELEKTDLIPFLDAFNRDNSLVMLSHVVWDDVDTTTPVSFSAAVITDYIRTQQHYDGILLTDDFSMDPVFRSSSGVGAASVATLNAGTDMILITYDQDLIYEAVYALLQADARQELDRATIDVSAQRLEKLTR